jgi:hypothetical protein
LLFLLNVLVFLIDNYNIYWIWKAFFEFKLASNVGFFGNLQVARRDDYFYKVDILEKGKILYAK